MLIQSKCLTNKVQGWVSTQWRGGKLNMCKLQALLEIASTNSVGFRFLGVTTQASCGSPSSNLPSEHTISHMTLSFRHASTWIPNITAIVACLMKLTLNTVSSVDIDSCKKSRNQHVMANQWRYVPSGVGRVRLDGKPTQ